MLKWHKLSQFLQGRRARLAPGERLYEEPFRGGFREGDLRVRIDRSAQRIRLDAEDLGETFVVPTLPEAKLEGSTFVGGAELLEKARTFEEGILAAVELALEEGLGRFPGRRRFLEDLLRTLPGILPGTGSNVAGVLYGAGHLAELALSPPPDLKDEIEAETDSFLADPVLAQPFGFSAWAESLTRIHRQDRMLSRELQGAPEISGLLRSLRGKELSPLYSSCLHLVARFRGRTPPREPDLQPWVERQEGHEETPENGVHLFPRHPLPAEGLWWRTSTAGLPPSGTELGKELAEALRDGIEPAFLPGWRDLEAWALSPLVCDSARGERERAVPEIDYRSALDDLFQAAYDLPRETSIQPLDLLMDTDVAFEEVEEEGRKLVLTPDLSVEPLPTLFLRRSLAYGALRELLTETFGPEAMASLQRFLPEGPVETPLLDELEEMARLYRGAFVVSAAELGFTGEERRSWEREETARMAEQAGFGDCPEAGGTDAEDTDELDAARFRAWAAGFRQDPDLGRDRREMVPVGREEETERIRVRAFLGWGQRVWTAAFTDPPEVEVTGERGESPEGLEIEWEVQRDQQIFPVVVEVSVPRLLDPQELREICDRHKTVDRILEHLE